MGQNLILNMNDHGFVVTAYNRTTEKVDSFLKNEAKGTKVVGAYSLEEMVKTLKKPRRVMMLVKGIWNIYHDFFCYSRNSLGWFSEQIISILQNFIIFKNIAPLSLIQ